LSRAELIEVENRTMLLVEFKYPFFFEISNIFDKASYNSISSGFASLRIDFASSLKAFTSITVSFLLITSSRLGFISRSI